MQKKDTQTEPQHGVKTKNYIRKFLKWILYVCITIVFLNVVLFGLLSIPFFQNKLINFAVSKIADIVKTEVRIDEIRLSLFNNIQLKGIYIEDQSADTLIYARNLQVALSPLSLLKNRLEINEIGLDNFTIKVSQKTPDDNLNFQFIIDAFAGDTTVADTTASALKISIDDIRLKNGTLKYNVLSVAPTPHVFNPSHLHIYNLNTELKLPSIDVLDLKASLVSLSFEEQSGFKVKNMKGDVSSDKGAYYFNDIQLQLPNSFIGITSASYNLLTSEFSLLSDKSSLSPIDVFPFMNELKHLKHDISLQTSIHGKLPSLTIDQLLLDYGTETGIQGKASISDYSRYDIANINLTIDQLKISTEAIAEFAKVGDSTFVSPDILKSLGAIRLQGKLDGTLNNFAINAEAWAKQGAIKLIGKGSTDSTFANFSANAKLQ
ncbi:MAG: hypothetical protein RL662_1325, partial [Bacteroidota bacterium]